MSAVKRTTLQFPRTVLDAFALQEKKSRFRGVHLRQKAPAVKKLNTSAEFMKCPLQSLWCLSRTEQNSFRKESGCNNCRHQHPFLHCRCFLLTFAGVFESKVRLDCSCLWKKRISGQMLHQLLSKLRIFCTQSALPTNYVKYDIWSVLREFYNCHEMPLVSEPWGITHWPTGTSGKQTLLIKKI